MLHVKYYIKKKYILIIIYDKTYGILFHNFFLKNFYNWFCIKHQIIEFLYEVGLLKIKKNKKN